MIHGYIDFPMDYSKTNGLSCLFVEDFTSQWLSVPLALLSKYGSLTGETPNPPVAGFI